MLTQYDIVTIRPDYPDADVSGRRGYVIGRVEGEDLAVFVYDLERVWCLVRSDVTPEGTRDLAAERDRGTPIRVSVRGEILD